MQVTNLPVHSHLVTWYSLEPKCQGAEEVKYDKQNPKLFAIPLFFFNNNPSTIINGKTFNSNVKKNICHVI